MAEPFFELKFYGSPDDYAEFAIVEEPIVSPCRLCGLGLPKWEPPVTLRRAAYSSPVFADFMPIRDVGHAMLVSERVRDILANFEDLDIFPVSVGQLDDAEPECPTQLWWCAPRTTVRRIAITDGLPTCSMCQRKYLRAEDRDQYFEIGAEDVKKTAMFLVDLQSGIYLSESLKQHLLVNQFTNIATRYCGMIVGPDEHCFVPAGWKPP